MKKLIKWFDTTGGKQIAQNFDSTTIKKITKGALIAGTGAISLYVLDFVGTIDFTNPHIAALTAVLVPTLINSIKEYLKGTK